MPTCGDCPDYSTCLVAYDGGIGRNHSECPARAWSRERGLDIDKMRKILAGDIRSPREGKTRQKFREWLDRASHISADDLNLVLKDVKIDPSK